MPHMTAEGGGAATYGTLGTDAANAQGMTTTRTSPQQPPLTQGHQGDGTATTGTGTQQRVHFDDLQFGDDTGLPPGGETMATLYASATAATRNLQLRQADTQGQQHTFAQHQYPTDTAAVTAVPNPTAQQQTGTPTAAPSAQPNSTRTSLQQTLPLNFYGPDMQAQILAQKQAEQDALQLQQACARNAAVHAAAKAAYEAQVAAQQTAAALRQQAPSAGPPPQAAPPTTTTTTTSLPSRVRALLSGVQPTQAQSILLTMAGAVPENAIPPAILEKMTMDDHAAVVDAFLQQTEATDISSIPPFGTSAFSHFWSLVTRFQLEAKEKQASSGAKVHADKSTGKLLERSTADAAHAPTQSAAANVYSSKECVDALKKFVDTKRVGSVDAVLAQVPAAARAVLMAKFDADAGTVLGADGQEAKRGALSIITEVLPQRVKNVIRSSPHSPDLNFPDREKLAKHVTHALYSTHAAPWTFVRTKQGVKLKNWDDWLLYMQHEPERWVNDTANAIDLFANAITAAHGYGAQATGPADTTATADDDTDNSKSLLIGSTNTDAVTYHCNWKWLQPWVEQFHNVATTIKNSQARSNESRVTVKPEFIIGKSNSILRQLVESFVAAIAEGQRYGTPIEYSEMVKQHYHGEGKGLSDSIQRFRNSSNPLMSSLMRDAMAQLFADSGGAELAIRTMTAATAPTHPPAAGNATDGGRRQRQSQHAQHQSPAPAPAPAPTPAPAPAPTPTAPAAPPPQPPYAPAPPCPPWMMMQPPPWWGAPPSHAPDATAQQPPTHQRQQEPQQAQHHKAGMLPPNQQPRPPPLPGPHARSPTGPAAQDIFEIKGVATTRFHPFAKQYGKIIRDEMTRTYNEDKDPEQTYAKSVCRPILSAIRRASGERMACDKWMTTGRCRQRACTNLHPDWSTRVGRRMATPTLPRPGGRSEGAGDVAANLTRGRRPEATGGTSGHKSNTTTPLDTEALDSAPTHTEARRPTSASTQPDNTQPQGTSHDPSFPQQNSNPPNSLQSSNLQLPQSSNLPKIPSKLQNSLKPPQKLKSPNSLQKFKSSQLPSKLQISQPPLKAPKLPQQLLQSPFKTLSNSLQHPFKTLSTTPFNSSQNSPNSFKALQNLPTSPQNPSKLLKTPFKASNLPTPSKLQISQLPSKLKSPNSFKAQISQPPSKLKSPKLLQSSNLPTPSKFKSPNSLKAQISKLLQSSNLPTPLKTQISQLLQSSNLPTPLKTQISQLPQKFTSPNSFKVQISQLLQSSNPPTPSKFKPPNSPKNANLPTLNNKHQTNPTPKHAQRRNTHKNTIR